PLVYEHATGNGDNESDERRPPSFPCKKQHQHGDNDTDPLPGAEVGECAQHSNECRSEPLMEPSRKLVISASKWIGQCELRYEILGEKKCVYHGRSSASLSPKKSESTNYVISLESAVRPDGKSL